MIWNLTGGGQGFGPLRKAAIFVKYPVGAYCTITNGVETYAAPNTAGSVAFSVATGTWDVSAELDGVVVNEAVTVAAGQAKSVSLSFFTGMIYDYGKLGVDLLFKNTDAEIFSMEYEVSDIRLTKAAQSIKAAAFLYAPIDVTEYSTLSITYKPANTGTSHFYAAIADSDSPSYDSPPASTAVFNQASSATSLTVTLDVSSARGVKYVGVYCKGFTAAAQTNLIYQIKLE